MKVPSGAGTTQWYHWFLASGSIGLVIYKSKSNEFHLLNCFRNTKWYKLKNGDYSPILHICMNFYNGRPKIDGFIILLDSGCSSTILNGKMTPNL